MSKKKIILLIAIPLIVFYVSLFVGRYSADPWTVLLILLSKVFPITHNWSLTAEVIVIQIRLPRAILAMFVGAGLSISGAAYQGMFRNPLVSPDILGVSAAAGFGATLAILLSANIWELQLVAFAFGVLGVTLTYFIARIYKTTPTLMLVLAGVVVAAFFGALVAGAKLIADPVSKLPAITYWLLGSFNRATYKSLYTVVPIIILGSIGLQLVSWRLNVLSMGDDEARSMGVKTESLKFFIIACTTLITASAVSVSGIVGWVGLVIPHVGRMIVGPNHRWLLPTSMALGAVFLLVVDDIARTATPLDIPIGILTGLIGAPFFAYLLRRTKGGWK